MLPSPLLPTKETVTFEVTGTLNTIRESVELLQRASIALQPSLCTYAKQTLLVCLFIGVADPV